MIAPLLLVVQTTVLPNQLTTAERSAGWRLLFDGRTLAGWRGVGYDTVDVPALTRHKVPLMVAGTANSPSVAEQAMHFMFALAKRGAEIIDARGASSAASAANAALEHMRDWALGTPAGDWTSMAVPSDGSYGVPEGLISSFPCVCENGQYRIVQGLGINEFSQAKIDATGLSALTTTPTGYWTVIQDGGAAGTTWGKVSWNGDTPNGTSLEVRVRVLDAPNA